MLKGLYDFTPISPKTLGFKRNERLLYLASVERDENWLRVSNCRGHIGLVPINYVDVDRNVTGSAVVDFLDESLQVARRGKSKFFNELQEIRRSILNPINDLERRIFDFQDIIEQLKAKGSPFCHRGGDGKCGKNAVSIITDSQSPSYLTFEEVEGGSNGKLFQDESTGRCYGDTTDNHNNDIEIKSARTIRSSTSQSKNSSAYVQYVNLEHDNESQRGLTTTTNGCSDEWCSNKSNHNNNNSDFDKKSTSGNTSITYTCPDKARKLNNSKGQQKFVVSQCSVEKNRKLCELIDTVRHTVGLSHDTSRKAVQTVLEYLQQIHQVKGDTESNIELFLDQLETPSELQKSPSFLLGSADYEKLQLILNELRAQAKDDDNWIIQDDQGTFRLLEELNIILREADERIVIKSLEKDDYQNVHSLALYYQKEHRWPRRQILIQSFVTIATIDLKALSVLVNSILPSELAREMMDGSQDKQRLEATGSLLGLLLSTGEKLPVTHLEFIGKDFLNFILDKIENTNDENFANVFINLILSYNLQFGFGNFNGRDDNLTIATLATRQNAKSLTQKTVHLLLWNEDPIQLTGRETKCPNSVLKLVMEMFSCAKIADLFYTNDVKVLIDIIIRSLMNWEPGDRKRTLYLQLIRMIIRNSNYREHNHRRHDLVKIFTLILLEEDPLAIPDQRLVREISNEFPTLIK